MRPVGWPMTLTAGCSIAAMIRAAGERCCHRAVAILPFHQAQRGNELRAHAVVHVLQNALTFGDDRFLLALVEIGAELLQRGELPLDRLDDSVGNLVQPTQLLFRLGDVHAVAANLGLMVAASGKREPSVRQLHSVHARARVRKRRGAHAPSGLAQPSGS